MGYGKCACSPVQACVPEREISDWAFYTFGLYGFRLSYFTAPLHFILIGARHIGDANTVSKYIPEI